MSNAATRQCFSEESCPPPFLVELAVVRPDELLYIHIAQCKNCGARFAAMQASNEGRCGPALGRSEDDTSKGQSRERIMAVVK